MTPIPSDASQAVELPPLPAPGYTFSQPVQYTAVQMCDYADAAIAQDRAARAQAEPVRRFEWPDGPKAMAARAQGAGEAVVLRRDQIVALISSLSNNSADHDIAFAQRVMDAMLQNAASNGDSTCARAVWWNHKRATFTTVRQAAFAAWDAAVKWRTAPAEVPGFVLVPREPTEAMGDAGERAWLVDEVPAAKTWADVVCNVYRAMIAAAAAPTPTASAPTAEVDAVNLARKALALLLDQRSRRVDQLSVGAGLAWAQAASALAALSQPPSEADRTREGGDVIYQNAGWVDFNEYQSFKACRSDRITLWTDNKGGMMPLYQQFGTTTSEGAK